MISSLHLYFLYYFYVSGILKKKRTYAILAIEKKLRSNLTHKENPRGGHLWGFPHHKDAKTGWLSLVISVQPFADKVTDNTRHDGENKRNYKIQLTHLLSVARLEKTTHALYHKSSCFDNLLRSSPYIIMRNLIPDHIIHQYFQQIFSQNHQLLIFLLCLHFYLKQCLRCPSKFKKVILRQHRHFY